MSPAVMHWTIIWPFPISINHVISTKSTNLYQLTREMLKALFVRKKVANMCTDPSHSNLSVGCNPCYESCEASPPSESQIEGRRDECHLPRVKNMNITYIS